MSRILVTGGSGFIGSALVKALVREGHAVRVLDDNSRGAPRRLKEVEKDIEFIAGDIRDASAVASAVRGMDEVHHLAYVNGHGVQVAQRTQAEAGVALQILLMQCEFVHHAVRIGAANLAVRLKPCLQWQGRGGGCKQHSKHPT